MSAVVERLSRASGHPLNVRQYGWTGANAPAFIASASALVRACNPAWAAVLLNSYNIGVNAVIRPSGEMSQMAPDGSFHYAPYRQNNLPGTLLGWGRKSVLALALRRRIGLIQDRLAIEKTTAQTASEEGDPKVAEEVARVPLFPVATGASARDRRARDWSHGGEPCRTFGVGTTPRLVSSTLQPAFGCVRALEARVLGRFPDHQLGARPAALRRYRRQPVRLFSVLIPAPGASGASFCQGRQGA
jgi:hypothetical protein